MKGIIDEVLKNTVDPITGEHLGCWATMNTEQQADEDDAEELVYDLYSQGKNSEIIVNFIDYVESEKLQLLVSKQNIDESNVSSDYVNNKLLPHIQTDMFIEEVVNIKLKKLSSGKFTVERVTRKVDKDRYSAVAYGLWYIKEFEDIYEDGSRRDLKATDYLLIN